MMEISSSRLWRVKDDASSTPALLTNTSSGPSAAVARSISPSTCAASASSTATASARTPSARSSATARSSASGLRPHATTFIPSLASACAMCLPMPLELPVTRAFLPRSCSIASSARSRVPHATWPADDAGAASDLLAGAVRTAGGHGRRARDGEPTWARAGPRAGSASARAVHEV